MGQLQSLLSGKHGRGETVLGAVVGPRSGCRPQILLRRPEFNMLNFWWQPIKCKGVDNAEMAGILDLKHLTAANMEELLLLVSKYPELYNTALSLQYAAKVMCALCLSYIAGLSKSILIQYMVIIQK